MIKNDQQLARAEALLRDIQDEIRSLENRYTGKELDFWATPIRDETDRLQGEIDEYHQLRALTFEAAVEMLGQHPVLLENTSELLAKLRIAAKLTQEAMAAKLHLQQSNVSRFESENYSGQTIAKVVEYAGTLGVWLHVTPSLTERPPKLKYHVRGPIPLQFTPEFPVAYPDASTAGTKTPKPAKVTTNLPETPAGLQADAWAPEFAESELAGTPA